MTIEAPQFIRQRSAAVMDYSKNAVVEEAVKAYLIRVTTAESL